MSEIDSIHQASKLYEKAKSDLDFVLILKKDVEKVMVKLKEVNDKNQSGQRVPLKEFEYILDNAMKKVMELKYRHLEERKITKLLRYYMHAQSFREYSKIADNGKIHKALENDELTIDLLYKKAKQKYLRDYRMGAVPYVWLNELFKRIQHHLEEEIKIHKQIVEKQSDVVVALQQIGINRAAM